jgi:hypothetical protein
MSTPTKDTVNAAALAAQDALRIAANAAFVVDADNIIASAVAQGQFEVSLPVRSPASMLDISTYYQGLGYFASYDQCSYWGQVIWMNPYTSYPFGGISSWYPYWNVCKCRTQCNIKISWK